MVQSLKYLSSGGGELSGRQFNPVRLTFARTRRGLKKSDLARQIDVTPRSVTGYENGEFPPEPERLSQIALFLKFPTDFFFEEDPVEELDPDCVSFRAMTKMGSTLRNIALGAGAIATQLNSWIESKFVLPPSDLPSLGTDVGPEAAAQVLRQHWDLGEQPIRNMVHLLEAKGVRVYSLSIEAKEVDAFSMWWNGTPFVFLNTHKSAEHSRFDAAHELGHLVMHRHGQPHGQEAEKEAQAFASALLMPVRSILASQLRFPTVEVLVKAKRQWAVSVAALNYRLHTLGLTSEWINRSLCIQIAKAGYRTSEPNTIARETSQILEKVFSALREEGIGKSDIARELHLSTYEIDELTYGLLRVGAVPDRIEAYPGTITRQNATRPKLSIVK